MSSVRISFERIYSYRVTDEGATAREDVARLGQRKNGGHVHGRLDILFGEEDLPYVSWPDDEACLGDWAVELRRVVNALRANDGEHIVDPCLQGLPAFRFVRVGDDVVVTLVESATGGESDPDWSATGRYDDLCAAVDTFHDQLRAAVVDAAGDAGVGWWTKVEKNF